MPKLSQESKAMVIERLSNALGAAVGEVQKDPEFMGRVVTTICTEFGLDPMTSMFIAGKLKSVIKKGKE